MRVAYADPPYLGCSKRLYGEHPGAADWDDPATHIYSLALATWDMLGIRIVGRVLPLPLDNTLQLWYNTLLE